MTSLVSLSDVKTHLGLDQDSPEDTSQDSKLTALIGYVSATIEKYTGRKFESTSYTETFDGGEENLQLANRPVIAVSSVTDLDPSPDEVQVTSTYRVDLTAGLVFKDDLGTDTSEIDRFYTSRNQIWGAGRQRWQVSYTAGYTTIPDDVKLAALQLIETETREAGVSSYRLGDYAVTYANPEAGMPATVKALLSDYRAGRIYIL